VAGHDDRHLRLPTLLLLLLGIVVVPFLGCPASSGAIGVFIRIVVVVVFALLGSKLALPPLHQVVDGSLLVCLAAPPHRTSPAASASAPSSSSSSSSSSACASAAGSHFLLRGARVLALALALLVIIVLAVVVIVVIRVGVSV
jgi:hypothetical protein